MSVGGRERSLDPLRWPLPAMTNSDRVEDAPHPTGLSFRLDVIPIDGEPIPGRNGITPSNRSFVRIGRNSFIASCTIVELWAIRPQSALCGVIALLQSACPLVWRSTSWGLEALPSQSEDTRTVRAKKYRTTRSERSPIGKYWIKRFPTRVTRISPNRRRSPQIDTPHGGIATPARSTQAATD